MADIDAILKKYGATVEEEAPASDVDAILEKYGATVEEPERPGMLSEAWGRVKGAVSSYFDDDPRTSTNPAVRMQDPMLSPRKRAELAQQAARSGLMGALFSPLSPEEVSAGAREGRQIVEGVQALPGALKNPSKAIREGLLGAVESTTNTALRGGYDPERPLSSTMDTLGVLTATGSATNLGSRVTGGVRRTAARTGSGLDDYSRALTAQKRMEAAKTTSAIEKGKGIRATRGDPLTKPLEAAKDAEAAARRALGEAIDQGAGADEVARLRKALQDAQQKVLDLDEARAASPKARPHYVEAGKQNVSAKAAKGEMLEALDQSKLAESLMAVRNALGGSSPFGLRALAATGGIGAIGGPGAAMGAFVTKEALRMALNSPKMARLMADGLIVVAQKTPELQRYAPRLRDMMLVGGSAGATRLVEEHARLLNEDPEYRAAFEGLAERAQALSDRHAAIRTLDQE